MSSPRQACRLSQLLVLAGLFGCGSEPGTTGELVDLPVSSCSQPWSAPDIALTLLHTPPPEVVCGLERCADEEHWSIEMRSRDPRAAAPKVRVFSLGKQVEELRGHLREVAENGPHVSGHLDLSEVTLSIRGGAAAPFFVVLRIVDIVARARIYRIAFVVRAAGSRGAVGLLDVSLPLPVDPAQEPPDRLFLVRLKRGGSAGLSCSRPQNWWRLSPQPFIWQPPGTVPEEAPTREAASAGPDMPPATWLSWDAAGQRDYARFLEGWRKTVVAAVGEPEIDIGAVGDVPLQAVIDLVGALRLAGFSSLGFVSKPAKPW